MPRWPRRHGAGPWRASGTPHCAPHCARAARLHSAGPARLSPELAAAVARLAKFLSETQEGRMDCCLAESDQERELSALFLRTLPPYFLSAEAAAEQPAAVESYLDGVYSCNALIQARRGLKAQPAFCYRRFWSAPGFLQSTGPWA